MHVKLTPTVNDSNATVKVGKGTSLTTMTSGAIALEVGANNAIKAVVTAEDGTHHEGLHRDGDAGGGAGAEPPRTDGPDGHAGQPAAGTCPGARPRTMWVPIRLSTRHPQRFLTWRWQQRAKTTRQPAGSSRWTRSPRAPRPRTQLRGLTNGIAYKVRLACFLTDLTGSDWAHGTVTPAPTVSLSVAPNPVTEGASVTLTSILADPWGKGLPGAWHGRLPGMGSQPL